MSRFHKKRAHVFFKRGRVFLKHDRVLKKDGGLWGSPWGKGESIFIVSFHLGRLVFRRLKRSDGSEITLCVFA